MHSNGGSKGGGEMDGSKFFQFHAAFGKSSQICMLTSVPPPGSWRPHLGEILDQPLLRLKISVSQFKMSEGPFGLDENDAEFLCRQKWVAWLPINVTVHT